MPSLDYPVIKTVLEKYPFTKFPIFIESGTYKGQTILLMEPHFEKLYTIELSTVLHEACKKAYKDSKTRKITFLQGESHNVFKTLLPTINSPTIFFLDGHWSCNDTALGSKPVPLLEELQEINSKFNHEAIIIIDDYRLFDGKDPVVDWSSITLQKVLNIFPNRLINHYFIGSYLSSQDRLILNIKKAV